MSQSVRRHWERARRYLDARQLSAARIQLQSLRALDPDGVRTRLLAANLAWYEGHPRDAAVWALDAAQVAVDEHDVLVDLIETLLLVGETAEAHKLFQRPVWDGIVNTDVLFRYANLCQRFRQHVQALAALDQLLVRQPEHGKWHFYRGQQLEFLGDLQQAEHAYAGCLARIPDYGYAAYALVRLRRQDPDLSHLELIDAGLRRTPPDSAARADFEFARYHVLDDLGQTDAAWQALETANRLMHGLMAADVADQQRGLQRFCSRAGTPWAGAATAAYSGPRPIFIVGMPRSGTTLLERMLANHSQVTGAGELLDFAQQLLSVADKSNIFDDTFLGCLPTLDLAEVGRRYLAQTSWRAAGKPCFVDKQPANWLLVGLIHAAIPEARILNLMRDPMDTCFGIWRARFASAHAWSYDIAALAARFRCYRGWMQHWHQASSGAILDVRYDELVTQPAATLRQVTDFCGLAWEAECEDLTRNTAPVSTLSAAQVRDPVNTRGLGRWRPYAAQLEPLRKLLSPS